MDIPYRADPDERTTAEAPVTAIIRHAAFLDELLAASSPSSDSRLRDSAIIDAWKEAYAGGDEAAFCRRLAWDGLDADAVAAAAAAEVDAGARRGWSELLADALAEAPALAAELSAGPLPEARLFEGEDEPRFFELVVPFLRAARRRVSDEAGVLLADQAGASFDSQLIRQLALIAENSFYRAFSRFRGPIDPAQSLAAVVVGHPPRGRYTEFVATMLAGAQHAFFAGHPLLARQLASVAGTWSEALNEMLARFARDAGTIAAVFGETLPLRIAASRPGLSDRHNGGRQVTEVTLTSGRRLIYKPRTVALERRWNEFLREISAVSPVALPSLRIIDCGAYGWAEYVVQEPVADRSAAEEYFRCAGALCCLAYLFGGKDLHMDNMVATPAGPVLVDSESLLQPRVPDAKRRSGRAIDVANRTIDETFVNTGLLTFLQIAEDGSVYDIGGLRGEGGHLAASKSRVWRWANSDLMVPEHEPRRAQPMANIVHLDGERLLPDDFAAEMIEGFRSMYRYLESRREETRRQLESFRGLATRMIFRPSNLYAAVIRRLIAPETQVSGWAATVAIDGMNRIFARDRQRPLLWPLVAAERQALERLDVPWFTAPVDAVVIEAASGETISGYILESGVDAAAGRLDRMSASDCDRQVAVLRAVLLDPRETIAAEAGEAPVGAAPRVDSETMIEEAVAIGESIVRNAIEGTDGSLTWIAPSYVRMGDRSDRGVSYYLYDGAAGIALLFAALARVTGEQRWRVASHAAFRPIVEVIDSGRDDLLRLEPIGGCNGIGSLVYATATAASLLDDRSLRALAFRTAALLTPQRIAADRRLDVEGGSAGALLALLSLHETEAEGEAIDRARSCARHLLDQSIRPAQGERAWSGWGGKPLTGFAHGAGGIAFALAKLGSLAGDAGAERAAAEAFAWEERQYDAAIRDWPVEVQERDGSRRVRMHAWCYGAPGIALARTLALPRGNGSASHAVASLLPSLPPVDHLCCGSLGRADIMLTIARTGGGSGVAEAGKQIVAAAFDRRRREGRWRLRIRDDENECFQPGLFKGLAGVAWTLLRFARPDAIPAVIAFERGGTQ